MKKDLSIIGGLFILIIFLLLFGNFFGTAGLLRGSGTGFGQGTASASTSSTPVSRDSTTVTIGKLNVNAKIAANTKDRQKGLSIYDSLPLDQGMLFVFDKSDSYIFWMKDMKFAIDIIWIDENKKVVEIAKNVPAEPGKNDLQLKQYKPASPAKYVLEVNAGLSDLNNVATGDIASFEL